MYFDIGSNIGNWSLANIDQCDKIISVEASPITFCRLTDNCKNDNNELSFETVHNIDEYYCETEVTVKRVLHYWNMTVQWWMANYVYKRIPFKSAG